MKIAAYVVVGGVALAAAGVELQPHLAASVSSNANRPSQTGYVLKRIPSRPVRHQQAGMPRTRLWESTAGNWSGYAVPKEGSKSDTFSDVQGTWVVPSVTGGKSATYSATWVGLDGYADGTVEQIGTEQDWTGRAQQDYVWFEMYPSGSYEIENFPANPGDVITAEVHYEGTTGAGRNPSSVFQLTIMNTTQNVSYLVPIAYTTSKSATRQSAEWIAEAPSSARGILPLADFGTVQFSNGVATGSSGSSDPISSWTYDPMTMIDPSGGGAVPSPLSSSGTAFSVSWSATASSSKGKGPSSP